MIKPLKSATLRNFLQQPPPTLSSTHFLHPYRVSTCNLQYLLPQTCDTAPKLCEAQFPYNYKPLFAGSYFFSGRHCHQRGCQGHALVSVYLIFSYSSASCKQSKTLFQILRHTPGMGLGAHWSSGRCPSHGREMGTRWSIRSLPTQTIKNTQTPLWVPSL